jgi:hydroxymethylpyrimidine/phosphomethylpyrimidine kinase
MNHYNEHSPIALTIAGSDPSGGAGIQCDLKVFQALGVYGLSVISCITSQVPGLMKTIHPLRKEQIISQVDLLKSNYSISAIKIGLLHNRDIIKSVIDTLDTFDVCPPVIIDPIIKSSSGMLILDKVALELYKENLIPRADLYTPNIPEGNMLINKKFSCEFELANALYSKFGSNLLLKGGHLTKEIATDIFINKEGLTKFESPMIKNCEAHGTGCFYSAAICAHVAIGHDIKTAISKSKSYINRALINSKNLGGRSNTLNFKSLEESKN